MKKLFLILLIVFNIKSLNAAENYRFGDRLFVASPKGLNLRAEPFPTSKILAELKYNSQITIIDKLPFTKTFTYSVTNFSSGTLKIKGFWVKVSINNLEGYVFDGNLTNYKYDAKGINEDYYQIFGTPKVDSIATYSEPVDGIKFERITIKKIYPKVLEEVVIFFDGCYDVQQTFKNITFNEAYWLMNINMQNADAANEIKINKEKNSIIFTYVSCT